MLGFAGSGFVKSSKDFQVKSAVIATYRSFENAEKILNLREKKTQLAKGRVSNVDYEQLNVRWVVNEICHTETTTDIFLIIKIECSWGIFSFI